MDLDDRELSMGKKVREAETEWIPYIAVVGEKEKQTGKLSVRVRKTGKQVDMTLEELVNEIRGNTAGFPYKPLPLPRLLSRRAKFVG